MSAHLFGLSDTLKVIKNIIGFLQLFFFDFFRPKKSCTGGGRGIPVLPKTRTKNQFRSVRFSIKFRAKSENPNLICSIYFLPWFFCAKNVCIGFRDKKSSGDSVRRIKCKKVPFVIFFSNFRSLSKCILKWKSKIKTEKDIFCQKWIHSPEMWCYQSNINNKYVLVGIKMLQSRTIWRRPIWLLFKH